MAANCGGWGCGRLFDVECELCGALICWEHAVGSLCIDCASDEDDDGFDDDLAVIDESPLCDPALTFRDGENDIIPF